jgi:hypothetical protein
MRAIAIEGFGGRDRLKLVDLPTPEPDRMTSSFASRPSGLAHGTSRRARVSSASEASPIF